MKNIKKYIILIPMLASFAYGYAMDNASADEGASAGVGMNIATVTVTTQEQKRLNCELKKILIGDNMPEDQFLAEIERLLLAGAQVDNYDGNTSLEQWYAPLSFFLTKAHYTCSNKTTQYNVVELLLRYGANVNNWSVFQQISPLMLCGYNPAIAQLLLQHGANVNAVTNTGFTALMSAVTWDNTETIQILINWGANKTSREVPDRYRYPTGKAAEDFTRDQVIKDFIRNCEPEMPQLW